MRPDPDATAREGTNAAWTKGGGCRRGGDGSESGHGFLGFVGVVVGVDVYVSVVELCAIAR